MCRPFSERDSPTSVAQSHPAHHSLLRVPASVPGMPVARACRPLSRRHAHALRRACRPFAERPCTLLLYPSQFSTGACAKSISQIRSHTSAPRTRCKLRLSSPFRLVLLSRVAFMDDKRSCPGEGSPGQERKESGSRTGRFSGLEALLRRPAAALAGLIGWLIRLRCFAGRQLFWRPDWVAGWAALLCRPAAVFGGLIGRLVRCVAGWRLGWWGQIGWLVRLLRRLAVGLAGFVVSGQPVCVTDRRPLRSRVDGCSRCVADRRLFQRHCLVTDYLVLPAGDRFGRAGLVSESAVGRVDHSGDDTRVWLTRMPAIGAACRPLADIRATFRACRPFTDTRAWLWA